MIEGTLLAGRYEVDQRIGTGGMSDVYRAKDLLLGRNVAIKVLKHEYSEDRSFVSKFRTEAQSAAGLEHPNIVNIYDVGIEEGMYYIVMEYVDGITLKTYIEKKRQLNFKESVSIAIQVARGIEAAHNKDIIHRDIKPQNIIISSEGKVKVTDFGIARAASANTISSDVMGSVHYASPEQARNGFVDERSDIYSLGIVMYEMITGRVPFDGETTVAVALQHLQDEMIAPSRYAPDIPKSFEMIIRKCTQKSQERRYQNIDEVITDLRRSLGEPNGNFVVIPPLFDSGKTRVISQDEVNTIRTQMAANRAAELTRLEMEKQSGGRTETVKPEADEWDVFKDFDTDWEEEPEVGTSDTQERIRDDGDAVRSAIDAEKLVDDDEDPRYDPEMESEEEETAYGDNEAEEDSEPEYDTEHEEDPELEYDTESEEDPMDENPGETDPGAEEEDPEDWDDPQNEEYPEDEEAGEAYDSDEDFDEDELGDDEYDDEEYGDEDFGEEDYEEYYGEEDEDPDADYEEEDADEEYDEDDYDEEADEDGFLYGDDEEYYDEDYEGYEDGNLSNLEDLDEEELRDYDEEEIDGDPDIDSEDYEEDDFDYDEDFEYLVDELKAQKNKGGRKTSLYEEDEEADQQERPFLEKPAVLLGVFAIIGAVVAVLYLLGGVAGLFRFSSGKATESTETKKNVEMVEMISILGDNYQDAEKALKKIGLGMTVVDIRESDRAEGTVISQNYKEGAAVEKGTTIEVVTAGVNPVVIPNVVGYNETTAAQTLANANLTAQKSFEYSTTIPSGTVISQDPSSGKVTQGTVVKLVVSQGSESTGVPNVVGKSEEYACKALEQSGFKPNVKTAYSNIVTAGFVIKQSPESGKTVQAGKTITITVSLGKESDAKKAEELSTESEAEQE